MLISTYINNTIFLENHCHMIKRIFNFHKFFNFFILSRHNLHSFISILIEFNYSGSKQ